MATKRAFSLLAIALWGAAQTATLHAQKPKAGASVGGGGDHAAKAMQFAQTGAVDQALAEYAEAIKASPKEARLYNDRGGLYLAMKKFPEAAADFSKAVELAPKDYAAYSNRGAALNEQNQFDAAMADLNKALELKPNDPRTLERRGLVYHKLKNYDAALADYNNALTQNPASTLGLR
ncbi:MAG: tetratricopeptide repeat protein, partial [Chthoniobacterales bacterium]